MTMKLEKKISLHAFEVEYIDQREAKPRTLHRESIVLDGGRMNTLDHLNQTPQSYGKQQMNLNEKTGRHTVKLRSHYREN